MTVGERIKNYREAEKLTVEELAERSGVSQLLIEQFESWTGSPEVVSPRTLAKIAAALTLRPDQLTYGTDGDEHGERDA